MPSDPPAAESSEKKADDKASKKVDKPVELSEEDRQLKEDLEMLLSRLEDSNDSLHAPALESIRTHIRTATSSMTSVPKPLKFLRPHYDRIKTVFEAYADSANKASVSDIVSLLAMTNDNEARECLHYYQSGTHQAMGTWGHEYVRHLASEAADEFKDRVEEDKPTDDLFAIAGEIIPYFMAHNAEADACDLLMEIERLDLLIANVDVKAYPRVTLYLMNCVPYVPGPEDSIILNTVLAIFEKFEQWAQAMQVAIKLNDVPTIQNVFFRCKDRDVRRQLAFMLARQQVFIDFDNPVGNYENDIDDEEREVLRELMSNSRLNGNFLNLARELDILDPKTPDDIYKTHLEAGGRSSTINGDSAKANLSSSIVNGLLNAGFGSDKLLLVAQGHEWLYKHKERGMMSAAASMGMLLLWDLDGGLTQIDKYMLSDNDYIKAGAFMAIGIVNSQVRDPNEPSLALLSDYVNHNTTLFRIGSISGLGLAYAGSANVNVRDLLLPLLEDAKSTLEVIGVTALALGQIFVGTCDGDITEALVSVIMSKTKEDLLTDHARYIALGLSLLYLGKQQQSEIALATLATVAEPFAAAACMMLEICAYAGTGNVLKIQSILHACSDHIDVEKEEDKGKDTFQAFATLGLACIAMGEEVGAEMSLRTFSHLLQYGEPVIRRVVPLAIALLCLSNPKLTVLDTLSKLSHDPDAETACNSIIALGLIGAGTNHARIAGMLRTLAQYYNKDADALFCVRLAQGFLHIGKGSISLTPLHTDRYLLSPVALAGLLPFFVACTNIKKTLLENGHYIVFHLALAMYPRILTTLDTDLSTIVTSVRVGNAVDVVGQAGKPKTITGFVTNNTPVLLGYGERAQLATDQYIPLTSILENFVILKPNPELAK